MAEPDGEIGWYKPYRRALFPISGAHVSRSLRKVLRKREFEVRFDTVFREVIEGCRNRDDTWISNELVETYVEIHDQGWGHSIETWKDGRLAGGIYGIALGGCFCAESMFHRETNASKVALVAAVDRCLELGFMIFDAQIMNPHLERMGAYEVPDAEYQVLLRRALMVQTAWSPTIRNP